MKYVLALDQGTTSSRAILFGRDGAIAGVVQHEFAQIYPDTGWVEHDPFEILTSQMSAADPYAGGMILGLERSTQIGHIARAAIESIAFQVADVLEAMNKDTHQPLRALRVDGGAAANDALMQFQADLLQVPVERPAVLESTALGAAYLAGLAVGFWASTDEIAAQRASVRVFTPQAERKTMEARMARWKDAVRRPQGWNKP